MPQMDQPDHSVGVAATSPSDLARRLVALACGPAGTAEQLRIIGGAIEQARAGGVTHAPEALAAVKDGVASVDPILRESMLAALTGDLNYYVNLISMVRNVMDLAPIDGINQIYWSMARQIFLNRMNFDSIHNFSRSLFFNFYQDFIIEIRKRYSINQKKWNKKNSKKNNIILVTNQFLSIFHQPTRDLLEQAAALHDSGCCDVTILNTNMMPDRYYSPFVPPFAAEIEPQLNGVQTLTYEGRAFRIISDASPGITENKVRNFISIVDEIDPDAVISIGGSVVIADILSSTRPCLCLQTTTGATISLAHLILDYGGDTPPGGDDHYARAWRPFRLRLSLRNDASPMTRAECQIPEDSFACIVVGNRLDAEASDAFLDLIERFVAEEPRAFVVFAGPVEFLPDRVAARPGATRMRCLGYVDHVISLMSICDVYINPRRTGGGASAMQALAAGLPIVSLAAGDVASVAGPVFCAPDADAVLNRLLELARDTDKQACARAQAQERYRHVLKEANNTEKLISYIKEAQELFSK